MTARGQILSGTVWGIGMALHEETLINLSRTTSARRQEHRQIRILAVAAAIANADYPATLKRVRY
jgi:CO/xanthine dehydrogenase Mo-binding subunit